MSSFTWQLGQSSTGNPTPTPTGMATPTPTGTGATPTPTGTATPTPTPHWRLGHGLTRYAGASSLQYTDEVITRNGNYSGTACWIHGHMKCRVHARSITTKTVMTYWVSKSTLEGIHVKMQMYTDNDVIYEHEGDIDAWRTGGMT